MKLGKAAQIVWWICRYFGLTWAIRRLFIIGLNRSGWHKYISTRNRAWEEFGAVYLARTWVPRAFLFSSSSINREVLSQFSAQEDRDLEAADRILAGEQLYFSNEWRIPPSESHFSQLHWSEISDFSHGDIKEIWEPSRFGCVFPLLRAYIRTNNEAYAEGFWRFLENWMSDNPPFSGPNWKCGQEASFRLTACCVGLYGFLNAKVTTKARIDAVCRLAHATGSRIAANLMYALQQKNNHGISEGMGLFTVGLLFPELPDSKKWEALGRKVLEQQGLELIYEDGAFSQHSFNYHRVVLHNYLWCLRLGDIYQKPFSNPLKNRIRAASEFLFEVTDPNTGVAPNHGANDGALIFPFNNCEYGDFRPVVQAALYYFTNRRTYPLGPWDEDLVWLFGEEALKSEICVRAPADLRADIGGYYTVHSDHGFAFIRSCGFRHRPNQSDQLHVDINWKGLNIAIDAGTYSYNAKPPFHEAFSCALDHNVVTVDGQDLMHRVGRFMLLPWRSGTVIRNESLPQWRSHFLEARHDGYEGSSKRVYCQRGVLRLPNDTFVVFDRLLGSMEHEYQLNWRLGDFPFHWQTPNCLTLSTALGDYYCGFYEWPECKSKQHWRACPKSNKGWQSLKYQALEPAISLSHVSQGKKACFVSIFSPLFSLLDGEPNCLKISNSLWSCEIQLDTDEQQRSLLRQISWEQKNNV